MKDKRITQVKAAEILKISEGGIRNLLRTPQNVGPEGLTSKKGGKWSNNFLPRALKDEVIKLIQNHYDDFGSTLVQEKLIGRHEITISVETVGKLMIKHNLIEAERKGPCLIACLFLSITRLSISWNHK